MAANKPTAVAIGRQSKQDKYSQRPTAIRIGVGDLVLGGPQAWGEATGLSRSGVATDATGRRRATRQRLALRFFHQMTMPVIDSITMVRPSKLTKMRYGRPKTLASCNAPSQWVKMLSA
jgi:hypothetical protein